MKKTWKWDGLKTRPTLKSFSASHFIMQHALPDCGFAAALSSLCKTNPKAIDECFASWNEKTVTVKLFKVRMYVNAPDDVNFENPLQCTSEYLPGSQISICVDNTIPKIGDNLLSARWVYILEKVFAIYMKNGFFKKDAVSPNVLELPDGKYGAMGVLEAIPAEVVLTAITGKKAKRCGIINNKFQDSLQEFTGCYDDKALQIYRKIEKKLKEHKPITCSFKGNTRYPIYSEHGYSVLEVKKSSKSNFYYITVKNSDLADSHSALTKVYRYTLTKPTDGTSPERIPKHLIKTKDKRRRDDKFETIKMELNEFLKNVLTLSIGSNKII